MRRELTIVAEIIASVPALSHHNLILWTADVRVSTVLLGTCFNEYLLSADICQVHKCQTVLCKWWTYRDLSVFDMDQVVTNQGLVPSVKLC